MNLFIELLKYIKTILLTICYIVHVLQSYIFISGEIFIPFYTGKVVDGIVIDKSKKEFTHAIMIMALITVGR